MALTKAVEAVDAWAKVAAGSEREGATVDVSPNYETMLHIDVCLAEAAAETVGATIRVQVSSNTTGDADWSDFVTLGGPTGTPIKIDFTHTEAAGQTVLSFTDPDTLNLDHPGKYLFIENTTPENSEIVFQVSNEGNAGDTITIRDGLANEQSAATSDVWEIDAAAPSSVVAMYNVTIPMAVSRVRVIYDNKNATGTDIFSRCRISKVTAV